MENMLIRNIEIISQNCSVRNKRNNYDYLNDGLLYCGKCRTPKQTRITIMNKQFTPFCLCKCESEKAEKEKAAAKEKEVKELIALRRKKCFGAYFDKLSNQTFANDNHQGDTSAMSQVYNYALNFEMMAAMQEGLLIYGNPGTGKSFAAACIANYVIDMGHTCFMTNFSTIINELTGLYQGKQEYLNDLNRYSLLIIDDYAAERSTEYANEIVKNVIEMRYDSGKPLIVTTNLTSEMLFNNSDLTKERVRSRLSEMCLPINFKGADKRKIIMQEKYLALMSVLNGNNDKQNN